MTTGTAEISACGRYRYRLTRELGPGKQTAVFVMLNPSTADADVDDRTVTRCMGFARSWGCGRLWIVNLFAYRATKPADLWDVHARDPHEAIGPRNDYWIGAALEHVSARVRAHQRPLVVCGWGAPRQAVPRARQVLQMIRSRGVQPVALHLTNGGHPGHPLYLKGDSELVEVPVR